MEQAKTWLMEKAEQQINLSGKLRNAGRLSKASRRGYVFETSKVKKKERRKRLSRVVISSCVLP